jgi:APA family basic amino acid/polyamine antiporter
VDLQRNITLTGAVAIVVGSVIGMGAFVLLPIVCSQAGGAAWLAIVLAVGISAISMLPLIQLGAALPTAGGGFEYGRRLLTPELGILLSWLGVLGGAAALALVSYGLVESFAAYLPEGVSLHLVALAIVMLFYAVQRAGVKLLSTLQVVLVAQMLLALLVYGSFGLISDGNSYMPEAPANTSFLMGLAVAFNVCLGFQVVVELGEEMRNPERNIFRTLVIGATVVLLFYLLIIVAYTHLVGVENLAERPDLVSTSTAFLPTWGVWFLQFGIVGAALTSFNGTAIAIPREIYAQGRAEVIPSKFSELDVEGNPRNAVSLYFSLVAVLLLLGALFDWLGVLKHFFGKDIIEFYGFITVSGILILTVGLSVAAWKLPKQMNEEYASSKVKIPIGFLRAAIIISVVFNSGLVILMCSKWLIPLLLIVFGCLVWWVLIRTRN